jgi:hypothetical protein
MPTILKTKNSVTTTVVPTTLQQGELAVNITDKKLWVGNAATTPVQLLGAGVTGDVVGPASATDNAVARFDATTGKLIQNSLVTVSDTGAISAPVDASISGLTVGKGGGAGSRNTTTGNGALASNTTGTYLAAFGTNALNKNTTGNANTAFGDYSLWQSTTASSNTGIGQYALGSNTTGADNTGVGAGVFNNNSTGSNNTGVGSGALQANTTASNNTAIGYQAGYANTTGTGIIAIGSQALLANTTGNYNVAISGAALTANTTGAQNVAVGLSALEFNTTASFNTAVGVQALRFNTTGANNAAFGKDAAYANTTGTENVAIGDNAMPASTTASNNTIVGRIAGTDITTGGDNTGIGRYSLYGLTTGTGNVGLGDILAGGRIFSLTTESNRLIAGHNAVTNAYVKVAWTVTSDARDKADVLDATYGLDFVTKLKPVTFKWDERSKYADGIPNGTHKNNKTQIGFLAQDVIALEQLLGTSLDDLLVADNEQAENLKITESKIIPALVKAIQELKAEVDSLKQQLKGN